jgi:hypothetical protein
MLVLALLTHLVLLANTVAADPIVVRSSSLSLPMMKQMVTTGDLVQKQQERARRFAKRNSAVASERDHNVAVTNSGVAYMASIGVGIPANYCGSP